MASIPHLEDLAGGIHPRGASSLLLWVILAFFVMLIAWAALTDVDRSVNGQGKIVPSSRLQIISNLEGGILSEILVQAGDVVEAGALLIRLDRTATTAELGSNVATVSALSAKLSRLEAEMTGRVPRFAHTAEAADQVATELALYLARKADLASIGAAGDARIASAKRGVAEAEAAVGSRRAADRAARDELTMIRPLVDRGIEPRLSLVRAESAAVVAASEMDGAIAGLARARSGVAEAKATLAQQRQDWRSRAAAELAAARAEFGSQSELLPALTNRLARTEVRASVGGRINRVLLTTVGGTVRPGEPMVEMVPSADQLIVEAKLSPRDISAVRTGQPARIRITAYDPSLYGALDGRVTTISPDATLDERTGEAYYLVRVETDASGLRNANGRTMALGAGMVADVSLLGEKRSVLSYLLSPFTRLRDTAFRE